MARAGLAFVVMLMLMLMLTATRTEARTKRKPQETRPTRVALVVSLNWGDADFVDVPFSRIQTQLPVEMADFTAAGADTETAMRGMLAGKYQTTMPTPTARNVALLTSAKRAGLQTAFVGAWNVSMAPPSPDEADQVALTTNVYDTLAAVQQITNRFTATNPPKGFFILVVIPFTDAAFASSPQDARRNRGFISQVPGLAVDSPSCSDSRTGTEPVNPFYDEDCPRRLHIASRRLEDKMVGKMVTAFHKAHAFVMWTAAHGPFSPYEHANSAPRARFRGERFSLYDGGIRVALRMSGTKLASKFAGASANAVDLLPTFEALWGASPATPNVDGINLLASSARPTPMQWTTFQKPFGNCMNVSPPRAARLSVDGIGDAIILYGKTRTEIYKWNAGFQLRSLDVAPSDMPRLPTPRPNYDFPACAVVPPPQGATTAATTQAQPQTKKTTAKSSPRIIALFIADDVGYGELGLTSTLTTPANSPTTTKTPHIDALAKRGAIFSSFYAAASVCSPTRASILTGRFPFHQDVAVHTAYHAGMSPREIVPWVGFNRNITFVTSTFARRGWDVGFFGKFHMCEDEAPSNQALGNDRFLVEEYKCYDCGRPLLPRANHYTENMYTFSPYASAQITTDGMAFVDSVMNKDAGANKAFVILALQTAHAPSNLLPSQFEELGASSANNPFVVSDIEATFSSSRMSAKPTQIRSAALRFMDEQVGRFVSFLEERGWDEDAVVVFTSDNGPENPAIYFASVGDAPHRGRKRSLLEGGIHVPLVMAWGSKFQPGRVVQEVVTGSVDLYPTLASLAGIDVSHVAWDAARLDGVDVSSCLFGACASSVSSRPALIWEQRYAELGVSCVDVSPRYAVRRGRFKLLVNSLALVAPSRDASLATAPAQLYDVVADPLESRNLASSNPDVVSALLAELRAYEFYDDAHWPPAISNRGYGMPFFKGFSCHRGGGGGD